MEGHLAILYALQLTPDTPQPDGERQQAIHADARFVFLLTRQSKVVVVGMRGRWSTFDS